MILWQKIMRPKKIIDTTRKSSILHDRYQQRAIVQWLQSGILKTNYKEDQISKWLSVSRWMFSVVISNRPYDLCGQCLRRMSFSSYYGYSFHLINYLSHVEELLSRIKLLTFFSWILKFLEFQISYIFDESINIWH